MRFTIRDLLWLMVVVGIAVAWWAEREKTAKMSLELSALSKKIEINQELSNLLYLNGIQWEATPSGVVYLSQRPGFDHKLEVTGVRKNDN